MEYIRVTQVVGENELNEIAHLEVNDGGWARLLAIFGDGKKKWDVGDCWVEPESKEYELDIADPITLSNDQSLWLLRDFYKCNRATMKRFKKFEVV